MTMKQFNGTDYDTLYPKTVYNQVSGVAPDGYGLGANTARLITDGNDALVGGWFYWGNIDTNLPFTYGHMRVDPRLSGSNGQILMQTAYSDGYPGCVAQRKMIDGAFKPWEWVNPPMQLGVEYRTTERWSGRPVYKKNVDFGTLPTGTTKAVSIGAENIRDVAIDLSLSYCRSDYGQNVLPITSYITGVEVVSGSIKLTTNSAAPSKTCNICVKYTKTTD